MALLQAPVVVALLWGLTVLALGWVLIPAVGFALGLTRIDAEVIEDPAAPDPRQANPEYGRILGAFIEMGFRPVGRVIESARFFSPLQLHWRSQGENWLVAKDGRTFVAIFKPRGREAWMSVAKTVFVGSGYLSTVTSRAGLQVLSGEQWRVEVGDVEPRELIAEHQRSVEEFGREHGVVVRAATFREMADTATAFGRRIFPRAKVALGTYPLLLAFFFPLYGVIGRHGGGMAWFRPLAICAVALTFAAMRWAVLPSRVPRFVRAGVMGGVLLIPALVLTRLPNPRASLEHLDADVRAGRTSEAVERIVAFGPRGCLAALRRYQDPATEPETRRALHTILVRWNGSDLGDQAAAWRPWCEALRRKN